MPERDAPPAVHLPDGPVRYAWFGGILDGRRGDDGKLREAVARGNRLGLTGLDLDVDGGRFSVMFDGSAVLGGKMTSAATEGLVAVLNDVVAAAADPSGVESTLRCTEVYDDAAVDTLFTPVGGSIECVSRPRAVEAEDQRHAPRSLGEAIALPRMGRRQALGLLALVLVAFGLLAWQRGLVDRIAARSPEKLEVDSGPFGRCLSVEVVSSWGTYRVTLRRGPDWPADAAAAQALVDAAPGSEDRAAARAVADGREVWLQLRDGQDRTLQARKVELARLLRPGEGDQGPSVEARLHGRMSARRLVLALDSGEAPR